MDIKAGLPCHIGVSESEISGNLSLTASRSNFDLKLEIISLIMTPNEELPMRVLHFHESIHSPALS